MVENLSGVAGLCDRRALCDALAMSNRDDLIGSKEACLLLDVNRSTLTRWTADGRLPLAHQLPGSNGAMLFHRRDVERLATATRATQAAS